VARYTSSYSLKNLLYRYVQTRFLRQKTDYPQFMEKNKIWKDFQKIFWLSFIVLEDRIVNLL